MKVLNVGLMGEWFSTEQIDCPWDGQLPFDVIAPSGAVMVIKRTEVDPVTGEVKEAPFEAELASGEATRVSVVVKRDDQILFSKPCQVRFKRVNANRTKNVRPTFTRPPTERERHAAVERVLEIRERNLIAREKAKFADERAEFLLMQQQLKDMLEANKPVAKVVEPDGEPDGEPEAEPDA